MQQAYANLSPDQVLNTVDALGFVCDGRLLALNSYENRVYRVGIENGAALGNSIVAKFYRPERWTDAQILEEHAFTLALEELEIPVVAPLQVEGATLLKHDVFRVALFANRGGRAPDLEDLDQLTQFGRFIGRIHRAGAQQAFTERPTLNIETFGVQARATVLESGLLPPELSSVYEGLTAQLLDEVQLCYNRVPHLKLIRCHGDCHPSNVLWTVQGEHQGPHIVDFDDARMAPAIQDLWMFIAGDRAEQTSALDALLEGYTEFHEFDGTELHLIEALRTLRIIHYFGWLTKRWEDPAFKMAFPWFNTQNAWEQHILSLREQAALLHEQPLVWFG